MKKMKTFFVILFLFVLILIEGCFLAKTSIDDYEVLPEYPTGHKQYNEEEFHIHADFKVYIDDKAVDFSVPLYQLRDKAVHVEDSIGELTHIHRKGITIGYFFETLGIKLNKTCISIPTEGLYCNAYNKKLSFYVNDIKNDEFENYEIKDLDKILVSYGEGDIKEQLESVTDFASKK